MLLEEIDRWFVGSRDFLLLDRSPKLLIMKNIDFFEKNLI